MLNYKIYTTAIKIVTTFCFFGKQQDCTKFITAISPKF